jgi:hypothetical protein
MFRLTLSVGRRIIRPVNATAYAIAHFIANIFGARAARRDARGAIRGATFTGTARIGAPIVVKHADGSIR